MYLPHLHHPVCKHQKKRENPIDVKKIFPAYRQRYQASLWEQKQSIQKMYSLNKIHSTALHSE